MNATTKAIADRLPKKPVLAPGEIAAAFGCQDATFVLEAIRRGQIDASCIGRKFYISRDEAARYIESTSYKADEA